MKLTSIVAAVGGLLLLLANPASAQTGPQVILCGYPVQVCASPSGGVPAQQAASQQQQQQQQVVVSGQGPGAGAAGAGGGPSSSSSSAASSSSGSGGGARGGGRIPFTGVNVLRWSIAAMVLMGGGVLLLFNSRRRMQSQFLH